MADKYQPFVFDRLISIGVKQGQFPTKSQAAKKWYREKAKNLRAITQSTIISQAAAGKRDKTDVRPGTMFFFNYDPKLKDELPFYDTFPLIFAVDLYPDGFLGINLHYLPLPLRGKLMDALYQITTNKSYTPQTQVKLSYRILKGASQLAYFKPCLKRYLYKQVRTKYVEVYPVEWDIALFLPVASFQKASQAEVWKWAQEQI